MKIGDKIKIQKSHPHKGETGIIIKIDHIGYLIKLDNCPHLIESCYVIREYEMRKIK